MASDLHPTKIRVFANACVGPLRPLAWGDLRTDHPMLDTWLTSGLVSRTDHDGVPAPDTLPQHCCGATR